MLEKHVSSIKNLTKDMEGQIKEDRSYIETLDSGFDKVKSMVKNSYLKIDHLVLKGSHSIWSYVVLFVIIFFALFYKLSKA